MVDSMRIKRKTVITLFIELLIVAMIFYGVNLWRTRDSASGPAPALAGMTISGERFDLSELEGQTALVHFWATWCPICAFEEGNIESVATDYPTITVALSSGSNEEIRLYLEENSLTFSVLNDNEGELSAPWGVAGVPMSFVIDKNGDIRFSEVGYTTTLGLRLRLWVAEHF